MKCEEVSKELIPYLDRRSNSAERRDVEEHLSGCESCRKRAAEFRQLWTVLDEVPVHEPSFGFDARLRQRMAAESKRRWFLGIVPQPRLAFSVALLLALSLWMAHLPQRQTTPSAASLSPDEQFQMIEHLGVLENYDLLTKSDVLAEVPSVPAQQTDQQNQQQQPDDSGGGL
ncbi:MAG TPA: zf-HC2 domain-containing protein [Candidatus Acidoferrales bacterium]|nr:zf-HC2 domain-containing protein [Candidatus Acidoferrales bacterium]